LLPQGLFVLKEIAMRIIRPILVGSFLLIATLPYGRARAAPPDAGKQTAVNADSPGRRDTYIQKSEEELDDWQAKLLRFDEEIKARAQKDGSATWSDLLAALDKAEAGAYRLQTVAADGLEDAKVSYEKSTSELADTWEKARSEDRR
jgi:small-conductance mechanosensitive channel